MRYKITPRDIARFWSKVDRSSGPNACWPWIGGTNNGYGRIGVCDTLSENPYRQMIYAHRFSWEIHNGPVPEGMLVCHHCDNRPCVNPKHFFLGTNADNGADARRKGRAADPPHHIGSQNKMTRLRESDVRAIRQRFAEGESKLSLARTFGVAHKTIRDVIARKNWRHVD